MEHLSGLGDISFTKTGDVLAHGVRYGLTVFHPDTARSSHVEATLELNTAATSRLEIGDGLTLLLGDGRSIDLVVYGRSRHAVQVLATSALQRRLLRE
jgi:hypothetical protein